MVYSFGCKSCGAPVAVQRNKENNYDCPYCSTRHHVSVDDSETDMENLSYKEVIALQMDMGKAQMAGVRTADMQAVMEASIIQQKLQKIMMRYNGKSEEEVAEIDRKLKEQKEEQAKRLAEADRIGDDLIYAHSCPNCGSPISHKPKNEYEEILCQTCGGAVKFEMSSAQKKSRTKSTVSQDDKAKRMEDLGVQIREAREKGDIDLANKLDSEYQELAVSFAANFDYSKHQDIYDGIAQEHGATMATGEMQLDAWREKAGKIEEQEKIQQEIESIEEKIEEISDNYEDDEHPELLEKIKPLQEKLTALEEKSEALDAEMEKLDQDFDDAKYAPLDPRGKIKEIMFEISRLDPDDYGEPEDYEADKKNLEEKKAQFIQESGEGEAAISAFMKEVEQEIEKKKAADAAYDAESSAGDAEVIAAAEANDLQKVIKLLNAPDTNASQYAESEDGEWLINIFVRKGNLEAVEYLLKLYCDGGQYGMEMDPDQRDHNEKARTILFTAVEEGHYNIAEKLVSLGADLDASDNESQTPLHYAVKLGMEDMAKLLVDNDADVEYADDKDNTPLHLALQNNQQEIARMIIEKGIDLDTTDDEGNTYLHLALKNNQPAIASMLIEAGADTEAENNDELTPQMIAENSGNSELTKLFQ